MNERRRRQRQDHFSCALSGLSHSIFHFCISPHVCRLIHIKLAPRPPIHIKASRIDKNALYSNGRVGKIGVIRAASSLWPLCLILFIHLSAISSGAIRRRSRHMQSPHQCSPNVYISMVIWYVQEDAPFIYIQIYVVQDKTIGGVFKQSDDISKHRFQRSMRHCFL